MSLDKTWLRRRAPVGEKKRVVAQSEKYQSYFLEDLLRLHKADWWHCTVAQASQPGYPDYTIFGQGWHAWLELKASNKETGKRGKVSAAQRRYQASIEASGGEWVTFCLPDDVQELSAWLTSHTGIKAVVQ